MNSNNIGNRNKRNENQNLRKVDLLKSYSGILGHAARGNERGLNTPKFPNLLEEAQEKLCFPKLKYLEKKKMKGHAAKGETTGTMHVKENEIMDHSAKSGGKK